MLTIAEIGLNHNGDYLEALRMVSAAKQAGADVAKFQFYNPVKVLGADHPALEYALQCQFTKFQHEEIKRRCDEIGIEYLVSVFDIHDVAWAASLCRRMKIATRMNKDHEFLRACRNTGKPLLISTTNPLVTGDKTLTYLYCVPKYPTALEDIDKGVLMNCEGLSTHCPNIAPAVYAATRNCKVLEAHVTYSRDLPGCDQSSSWTFEELKQFVSITKGLETLR